MKFYEILQADVLACAVDSTLSLKLSNVTKAIEQLAGPWLQKELWRKYPQSGHKKIIQIDEMTDIAVDKTRCALQCKYLFFVYLPHHNIGMRGTVKDFYQEVGII